MSDDELIAGAVVPTRRRWITSAVLLDALWVAAVSLALIFSSFFDPAAEDGTRIAQPPVFLVALPLVAMVFAMAGVRRGSEALTAVGTGVLAPGVALAGSLSSVLFVDDVQRATAAVAALAAGLLGLVMFTRWFVYHPLSLLGDEARPRRSLGIGVVVAGVALAVVVVSNGVGDPRDGVAGVVQVASTLTVPTLLVIGGVVRTVPSVALATAGAAAQAVAVVIARLADSSRSWSSEVLLRTGVVGVVVLVTAVAVGVASLVAAGPDTRRIDPIDDEPWRWRTDT